jgi:hypothetical protein
LAFGTFDRSQAFAALAWTAQGSHLNLLNLSKWLLRELREERRKLLTLT